MHHYFSLASNIIHSIKKRAHRPRPTNPNDLSPAHAREGQANAMGLFMNKYLPTVHEIIHENGIHQSLSPNMDAKGYTSSYYIRGEYLSYLIRSPHPLAAR